MLSKEGKWETWSKGAIDALNGIIRKVKPDILHAHYLNPWGYIGALVDFHPFVATPWGSDIYMEVVLNDTYRELSKMCLARADLITVDSYDLKRHIVNLMGGSREEKVKIIQWGVKLNRLNKMDIEGKSLKDRLGIRGSPVVLSTRNFKPLYNIKTIINAIPYVRKEVPDVRFVFLGSGPQEEELRRLATTLKVEDTCLFIGSIQHKDIFEFLGISDVFVSLAASDSTPVSLLEAMACGVPPVVSDLPSIREWIRDGWNGSLIPIQRQVGKNNFIWRVDHLAFVDAVIRLLKDKALRDTFKERNYQIVARRGDAKVNMEKMESLYRELLV
jgi:glycosyltransferase involved in cell wall biosynthesis